MARQQRGEEPPKLQRSPCGACRAPYLTPHDLLCEMGDEKKTCWLLVSNALDPPNRPDGGFEAELGTGASLLTTSRHLPAAVKRCLMNPAESF